MIQAPNGTENRFFLGGNQWWHNLYTNKNNSEVLTMTNTTTSTAANMGTQAWNFGTGVISSLLGIVTGTFDIVKGYATNDKTRMLVIGAVILFIASKIFKVKVGK